MNVLKTMPDYSNTDYAKRLQLAMRRVHCKLCDNDQGLANDCIQCQQCTGYFHKLCIDPMREQWDDDEKYICDSCATLCVICNEDDDDKDAVQCDGCDDWFHIDCLDEDDRPLQEVLEDEEEPWYCAECWEEYGSDEEWASEHIVNENAMTREDCFTRSSCECQFCKETNMAVDTWTSWEPQNNVQRAMKRAIDENDELVNNVMDNLHFTHGLPPPHL